ncbi:Zinc finger protein 131 [Heterocephalus glaber]|uniref:Zinc finger protein 131 n=1 Tax=Heterocephalus glaber TaxID=10181 RepID=G5BS77_HETGA|nr:Zinc finger protein 131 [Heterocephalus glaber]
METEETMECLQEFPEHHKMILDRLNEQREQDRFTDITLIVDRHHFKAHKAVLAACRNEFRRHLDESHNISEHLVTEEVLSVETHVQTEPVTSMTVIEQVGKVHMLPLLQVQVDSAQVTVEQVHPDLLQDGQAHDSYISVLPEQVQTEERTEVHVEELHVEWVNQIPVEVQTELLEADLDHVTPEIMSQEEREPSQADGAEVAREDHEGAEGLNNKLTVDSQAEKTENEDRTVMPVLE